MDRISHSLACRLVLVLVLSGASLGVSATERRFVPVPATEYQKLQVINGATIISAAGQRFHAGASITATSSRQAWLSISVKNTGAAPVPFDDTAIVVMSGGNTLGMKSAEEVMGAAKGDGLVRDKCANASDSSQLNCNIDNFNKKQGERNEAAAAATLAPGALVTRQFQMELPKRSKTMPATLKVVVTVEGETIEFDFNELN